VPTVELPRFTRQRWLPAASENRNTFGVKLRPDTPWQRSPFAAGENRNNGAKVLVAIANSRSAGRSRPARIATLTS
jgi:hypothetical protein